MQSVEVVMSRLNVLIVLCVVMFVAPVYGQLETGRITGTVTDATGAVVPGTRVTVIHVETNRQFNVMTDADGRYVSALLPIGNYRVEAEFTGFKRVARSGIRLEVQQTAVVDLRLELGEISDRVEVQAEAPLLNVTEATQGQVIENKRIVDIPLNGRDYIQLALLAAGTVQDLGGRFGGFSAGGQRTTQNNYLLDGVDNNTMQNAAQTGRAEVIKPSVDAIQEFKVLTSAFSAEYGRAGGGVVSVVLKSGTNQFHGTVFGFLRNEALDARNFFDRSNRPKPPFKRSQFGFALGGPIRRDKTFFFGDYEGTRIRESRTVNNTIPTIAMRSGDFSGLGITIFDPLTYDPVTRTRQPFANNRIPDARIDPIARALTGWYPTPQTATRTQNFLFNPPDTQDVNKFDTRVDHVFSAKDNIYYRFSFQRNLRPPSPGLPGPAFGGSSATSRPAEFRDTGASMALVWNHVFTPNLITSTRAAWNGTFNVQSAAISDNVNTELGLRNVNQSEPGAPQFDIAGYSSLGIGAFLPHNAASQTRQVLNDTTWVRGRHVLKAGVNIMWLQQHLNNLRHALGQYSFNGSFTRNSQTLTGGDPFADFLLGLTNSARYATPIYFNLRAPWYNFYVSDEWKASRRLTLTLGMRYEARRPWVETRDLISNFDVDTDRNNPRLVLAQPDGSRAERATMEMSKTDFAPRFGFAYQTTTSMVIRGGYGLFWGMPENTSSTASFNPPYFVDISLAADGITPRVTFASGIPPGVLDPANARAVQLNSRELRPATPYTHQWNLNIQRQLGRNWLFETGYYGTAAHHLQKEFDINFALPGPGTVDSRRRFRTFVWPGTNTAVSLAGVQRGQHEGNSNYHSFQAKLERRFAESFSLLTSYLWSKAIGDSWGLSAAGRPAGSQGPQNPLDHRPERALDDNHLAHRFVASPIWDLPFGRGRAIGKDWNGALNAILGGWSTAAIVTLTSGRPYGLTVRGDPANTGMANRPNVVGNPHLSRSERTVERFFNTAAFVPNAQFSYGNAGRNILIGPGLENVDFAAYKSFNFTEDKSLQFRFEAFNFFNTPNFAAPNSIVGDPNIGRISAAGRQRNIQFGLKFNF